MRGSSQTSLDQAKAILDSDFAAPTLAQQLSSTLFGLLDALDSAPALGRLLANPNRPVAAKTGVIKQILAEQSPAVVGFAEHLVRARWSHDADLAEAVEQLAVAASLNVITSNDGSLMAFEQAVFDFDRLCAAHCPLRLALADPQAPPAAGRQLVEQLSGLTGVSLSLLQRAVLQRRGRSLAASLLHLGQTTAARRGRLIAQVTAGQPLRDNQLKRLEELLSQHYGQSVKANLTIDRAVVGGLTIRLGDDLIDATVLARLGQARRQLATQNPPNKGATNHG